MRSTHQADSTAEAGNGDTIQIYVRMHYHFIKTLKPIEFIQIDRVVHRQLAQDLILELDETLLWDGVILTK